MPYSDPLLAREATVGPNAAVFASRVQGLLDAMAAAGHPAHLISGYRSPEEQAYLVAHPQGNPVAAPGASFHNFGAAADIVPNGDYASGNALLQRLAANPAMGLTSLGAFDPNHVQLSGVTIDQLRGGAAPAPVGPAPMPGSFGAYAQSINAREAPVGIPAMAALAHPAAPLVGNLHVNLPGANPPAPAPAAPAPQAPQQAPVDWGSLLSSITAQKPAGPSSADIASNLMRGPQSSGMGSSDLLAGTAPNLLLTG